MGSGVAARDCSSLPSFEHCAVDLHVGGVGEDEAGVGQLDRGHSGAFWVGGLVPVQSVKGSAVEVRAVARPIHTLSRVAMDAR